MVYKLPDLFCEIPMIRFSLLLLFCLALPSMAAESYVTGIGGVFFKSKDPAALAAWYQTHLGISPAPSSEGQLPWKQDAGFTVFSPFPEETDYFGAEDKQWMINFRVRQLDKLVKQLNSQNIEVSEIASYPHGRFAYIHDPENNRIELWEPPSE